VGTRKPPRLLRDWLASQSFALRSIRVWITPPYLPSGRQFAARFLPQKLGIYFTQPAWEHDTFLGHPPYADLACAQAVPYSLLSNARHVPEHRTICGQAVTMVCPSIHISAPKQHRHVPEHGPVRAGAMTTVRPSTYRSAPEQCPQYAQARPIRSRTVTMVCPSTHLAEPQHEPIIAATNGLSRVSTSSTRTGE
jgi:hypothetical protein